MATSDNRFPFTVERLAKLTCPPSGRPQRDGRVWFYDTKVDGLAFSITEGGSRAYFLYRRIQGKPTKMKIGTVEELNIEQARRRAAELNSQVAQGRNPATERKQDRQKGKNESTISDLWASYRDHWLFNKRPRTIGDFTQRYESYLSKWSQRPIRAIEQADVEKLKAEIGKKHQVTANRVLSILSAMYERRGRMFGLPRGFNPTVGVDHYPEHARDRVLSSEELGKVIGAIDADEIPLARDLFRILIYTGQRKTTVARMSWQDISLERGTWKLPGEKTKNGQPLVITLIPEAIAILQRRNDDNPVGNPYVFPGRSLTPEQVQETRTRRAAGASTRAIADEMFLSQTAVMRALDPAFVGKAAVPYGGIAKSWSRIFTRAGIPHCTIHDIRRSFCTALVESGTPLPIVSAAMGHRSMATTQKHYAFASDAVVANAVRTSMAGMLASAKKSQDAQAAKIAKSA